MTAALLALPAVTAGPAHAYSSQQWALDYLKASQDWKISKGANVTVAVIDTGVASVPDLNGRVLSGADFSGGTTTSGNGRTDTDNDGHGTGMASVIAANGTSVEGLASAAKILPVRVAVSSGGFLPADIAAAIQFAVSKHVGVINLSFGNPQDFGPDVSGAIAQAVAANIVVVAATGNQDNGNAAVQYPAAYPGVVAVGAVDQSGHVWSQSSYGPRTTLTAPGVQIYRDDNFGQQGTSSGTSEATAYVSAAAALIRSAHPDWTAGQVIRDLISTAGPGAGQSAGQHSDQYGYGILDPLKALQAAAPTDTTNPLLGTTGSGATAGATPSTSPASGTGTDNPATAPSSQTAAPKSSHTGLTIGIVVGVIILLALVSLIVFLARRGPKPPSGPGRPGPTGYQPPYPQQDPYQQHSPYQQSPYQQSPYQQQSPYSQQPPNSPYQQPPRPPQNPTQNQ